MRIQKEIQSRLAQIEKERRWLLQVSKIIGNGNTPSPTVASPGGSNGKSHQERSTMDLITHKLKSGPKSIYNLAGPRGTKKFRRFEVAAYEAVKKGTLVKIVPGVFAINQEAK